MINRHYEQFGPKEIIYLSTVHNVFSRGSIRIMREEKNAVRTEWTRKKIMSNCKTMKQMSLVRQMHM